MWNSIIAFFTKIQSLIYTGMFLITICYVILTSLTFHEIKKQTDNQIRSKLFVRVIEKVNIKHKPNNHSCNLQENFEQHLKNFGIPTSHKYLFLQVENIGKSNVISYEIFVKAIVDPGKYLHRKNIAEAKCQWVIKSKDMLRPNVKEDIFLADVGNFPCVQFHFEIVYTDLVSNWCTDVAGTTGYQAINPTAFDYNVNSKNQNDNIKPKPSLINYVSESGE